MKVKLLTALLAVAVVGAAISSSATFGARGGAAAAAAAAPAAPPPPAPALNPALRTPEVLIDGSKNPDKISDRAAYSLLLRFLSGRKTEDEKRRARSYLKMVFSCSDCQDQAALESHEAEIDAVLAAAGEFEKRVAEIDSQAKAIKERAGAQVSDDDKIRLGGLQKRKEALVDEVTASLHGRLGQKGSQKLRGFVKEHMKPKMKVTLPPAAARRPANGVA